MRLGRRHALLVVTGIVALAAAPALAFQMSKFSAEALKDAQKTGQPVLVEISAPWCPTCKAQKPVLDKLFSSAKFKSFITLDVDFDTQKADVKALGANMQSTLIVYKGNQEVGRSVGVTDPLAIEALLAKAL